MGEPEELEAKIAQLGNLPEEQRVAGVAHIAFDLLGRTLGRYPPEVYAAMDVLLGTFGGSDGGHVLTASELQRRAIVLAGIQMLHREGKSYTRAEEELAVIIGETAKTIGNWRSRWRRSRQARALRIDDAIEDHIIGIDGLPGDDLTEKLTSILKKFI